MNYHFGLALGRMNMPPEDARVFPDLFAFSAIELPIELFTDPNYDYHGGRFSLSRYHYVHCGGIMNRTLSNEILTASHHQQNEFIHAAEKTLRTLRETGVTSAALEVPMAEILDDPKKEGALRFILVRLAPVLMELGMTLMLPYRIPSCTAATAEKMNRFLRNTMVSQVKLRIDLHPYELPEGLDVRKAAGMLGYELHSLIFVYDADSGRRIMKKHILPWLDYFGKSGFCGPYLLAPCSLRQRMALPEADTFSHLIPELRSVQMN